MLMRPDASKLRIFLSSTLTHEVLFQKDMGPLLNVDVEKPGIIAITETWVTVDHLMNGFTVLGY